LNNDIPVVSGTTGWLDKYNDIIELCKIKNGSLLQSSNFSIGVNIFFELNRQMSKIINNYNDYDIRIHEEHHIHKKDSPSGTAIKTAEYILENIERKSSWTKREALQNEILISSTRQDEIFGNHYVSYESTIDKIEISHIAKSREGFAMGAIIAAEYIYDKKGIFSMRDILKF
jgi:4-hydroxy-tetrahydrodipicolinate reductase